MRYGYVSPSSPIAAAQPTYVDDITRGPSPMSPALSTDLPVVHQETIPTFLLHQSISVRSLGDTTTR